MISLYEIAYARSGDKGADANIGVIAYTPVGYEYLRENLTQEKVKDFFFLFGAREVLRYELPNLLALNFVLKNILNGGGSCNLRVDAQGKALGQALLEFKIPVPEGLLARCRKAT